MHPKKNDFNIDSLTNYGRSKLEEYKIPKEFYDKIPRNDTGKVLKNDLMTIIIDRIV